MSGREREGHGVQLPKETSASALLHRVLTGARDRFASLSSVEGLEDARSFRSSFADILPRFEAARVAGDDRSAIARAVTLEAAGALVYRTEDGKDVPLREHLAVSGAPLELEVARGRSSAAVRDAVVLGPRAEGETAASELVAELARGRQLTHAAAEGIRWTIDRSSSGLDLRGKKFVLLGAGAELAPTPLLLQLGADVLWIDVVAPKLDPQSYAGTLHFAPGGADILTKPRDIVATIESFANGEPVYVGMFAYAAGQGREWRLEASMNAITRALPRGMVAGVGIYISPTSTAIAQPEDVQTAKRRREEAPLWQRALARTGALGRPFATANGTHATRTIVPVQGASYQAAQYVAKALVAEAFASSRRVGVVSANVAGITNTGSMAMPVFQAGFVGAPLFGVRVFEPAQTRWLSGLLLLHDWLSETNQAATDGPAALFARQIHGGVYSMAYALDDAIKLAALYGFTRRPKLLTQILRR